jgi:hypothetical protein
MASASRELLASREDVWRFLAEPYHLSDWWPGVVGVEPDRRGFEVGARWRVETVSEPLPIVLLGRLPRIGRPSGPTGAQTLVISAIEAPERWSWQLVSGARAGRDGNVATRLVEVSLDRLDADRTEATVEVTGGGARRDPALARAAADRLFDLVQTAAAL